MSKFTPDTVMPTYPYKGSTIIICTKESIRDETLYRAEIVTGARRIQRQWLTRADISKFEAEALINSWN